MCGIVGGVSKNNITKQLIDGLKKLEYRGYDSAGIALIDNHQQIKRLRLLGKVQELENALAKEPITGHAGIAHTRWATHGAPSEKNAHPFVSHDEIALVHNGIIENYHIIRKQLSQEGYQFLSDTDTEVIVHLIHKYYTKTKDLLLSIRTAISELKGAYALGIICRDLPDHCIAVRQGSPLVIGSCKDENLIASDPLALLSLTSSFIYLEDNDIADITANSIMIYDQTQKIVKRRAHSLNIAIDSTERGQFRHYMQKEIFEQPHAIHACLEGRVTEDHLLPAIFGPDSDLILAKVKHVQLVACGTSYHAAAVGKYWIEHLAGVPCSVEIASEFRYRKIAKSEDSLFVVLSQSGETADSLGALRLAKEMDYLSTLAICNVPGSTMMRETDLHFLTHAGIEIGVASTKAFTTQLVALFLLALTLTKDQRKEKQELIAILNKLPEYAEVTLQLDNEIANWAKAFTHKEYTLFLGRGMLYPVALEGALKLKEISYIHAEAYPAGELKHGPLALIDNTLPVIAMAPSNYLLKKNLSNLQEVDARGGKLFILTDDASFKEYAFSDATFMIVPSIHFLFTPVIYTIPLQLLAYHVAVLKGTDIDQPRNLAKSVTVE